MADLISVSSVAMREKGNALIKSAGNIQKLIEDIKGEITKMKSVWEGDAAEKFVLKFNGLNDDFQERIDVINSYGNFLLSAADDFDAREGENINAEDSLIS